MFTLQATDKAVSISSLDSGDVSRLREDGRGKQPEGDGRDPGMTQEGKILPPTTCPVIKQHYWDYLFIATNSGFCFGLKLQPNHHRIHSC